MRAAWVLGLAVFAGCGGGEPIGPADAGLAPPDGGLLELDIGTGRLDGNPGFVPVEDGADLVLSPGSQGGFHVFVNLRIGSDLAAAVGTRPMVRREARRVRDGVLVSRTQRFEDFGERGGAYQTLGSLRLFLCPTPIGVEVADERLELEVELAPSAEASAAAVGTLRFTPVCPENEQAEFCRQICFG